MKTKSFSKPPTSNSVVSNSQRTDLEPPGSAPVLEPGTGLDAGPARSLKNMISSFGKP